MTTDGTIDAKDWDAFAKLIERYARRELAGYSVAERRVIRGCTSGDRLAVTVVVIVRGDNHIAQILEEDVDDVVGRAFAGVHGSWGKAEIETMAE
ncbi:MAG TPA: hypothetical protein VN133_13670 [Humibacter sp.]|nr:hypothetical protein [Humibacter sp.]